VGNLNRCLEHAKGKYIKILCADDILEPTCLEKSVNVMENHTNVELVSVGRLLVTEKLYPIKTINFSKKFKIISGKVAIKKCLIYGNKIGEPTAVLFRKRSIGCKFDPLYTQITDLEMWFRCLELGDLAHIPENLCKIRQHGKQETNIHIKQFNFADEEFMLLKEYFKKDYVSLSFIKKKIAIYNRAYLIWDLHSKYSSKEALSTISKYCNLKIFYVYLGLKNIRNIFVFNVKNILKYIDIV